MARDRRVGGLFARKWSYTSAILRPSVVTICHAKNTAGKRFIANTPDDDATLNWMTSSEILGQHGRVTAGAQTNLFRFG
jgi:hypothetical protein